VILFNRSVIGVGHSEFFAPVNVRRVVHEVKSPLPTFSPTRCGMLIYKITCKLNNMGYVGKTTRSLEERIAEHLRNKRNNSYIDNAIRKYG